MVNCEKRGKYFRVPVLYRMLNLLFQEKTFRNFAYLRIKQILYGQKEYYRQG